MRRLLSLSSSNEITDLESLEELLLATQLMRQVIINTEEPNTMSSSTCSFKMCFMTPLLKDWVLLMTSSNRVWLKNEKHHGLSLITGTFLLSVLICQVRKMVTLGQLIVKELSHMERSWYKFWLAIIAFNLHGWICIVNTTMFSPPDQYTYQQNHGINLLQTRMNEWMNLHLHNSPSSESESKI